MSPAARTSQTTLLFSEDFSDTGTTALTGKGGNVLATVQTARVSHPVRISKRNAELARFRGPRWQERSENSMSLSGQHTSCARREPDR